MKIAILFNENEKLHSTNWSLSWVTYCKENQFLYEIVDPYGMRVIDRLMGFDIVLWHYSHYSFTDMLLARNILFTLEHHGKKVFPSFKDAWHFDDKLAETYLLESIQAPLPESFYFYDFKNLAAYLKKNTLTFPIIAKLRNGSGSHNVTMIHSKEALMSYAKIMFTTGINSAPSLLYKATSNLKSSKSLKTFISRVKRIPEFLRSLSNAKKFNKERGYVYLQEFIPNAGYDLKIVVVGAKLSFVGRNVRQREFRASGGGDSFFNKDMVIKDVIDSAFKTSEDLGFSCMGYDYVVHSKTQKGIIVEMSYGFSHQAILSSGGFFDRNGSWHDEPLHVPNEILKNIISDFSKA